MRDINESAREVYLTTGYNNNNVVPPLIKFRENYMRDYCSEFGIDIQIPLIVNIFLESTHFL